MLPACRTGGEGFAIPTFDLVPSDVEGFMEELWEFQSVFHDCFARSEPRGHFFDYMIGQFSKLERKSIEPMALQVEGGTIRGLQRFISDVRWDEEQMRWNYHQLVAEEMGDPDGVLMFDETGFVKKGKDSAGVARQYCGTLGKVENWVVPLNSRDEVLSAEFHTIRGSQRTQVPRLAGSYRKEDDRLKAVCIAPLVAC